MRRALVSLLLLALLTFSNCGGGGGASASAPAAPAPPLVVDYLDFAPYARPVIGTFSGGTFTTSIVGVKHYIRWAGVNGILNDEEFEIRTNPTDGREWIFLCAYIDPKAGRRYLIEVTSAVIEWPDGRLEDVTPKPDVTCHPYAMRFPPLTYTMIVRAKTHNDPGDCATQADPAACNARTQAFFWKALYTGPALTNNRCWTQDVQTSRMAFRQAEAYWDAGGGWSQASGGAMGADGTPTGAGVTLGRFQTIGVNAGFAWSFFQSADPTNIDPLKRDASSACLFTSVPQ